MTQDRPGHDQFDDVLASEREKVAAETRSASPPGIPLDAFWSLVDPEGVVSGI